MKKKFLALASLFCSAALCVGVGAAVLNNNEATQVSAEAVTSEKEINGVTYTFEGNIEQHSTQDLGDLIQDAYKPALASDVGLVGGAVGSAGSAINTDNHNPSIVLIPDATWAKGTGGVSFSFKTDNEWYRPAGKKSDGTAVAAAEQSDKLGIEIWMGDMRMYLMRLGNWDNSPVGACLYSYSKKGDILAWGSKWTNSKFFEKAEDGNYYMDQYAGVKISRYACTSATGYWLKVSLSFDGSEYTVYDNYVNAAMSADKYTHFGIRNVTMHDAGLTGYTITEAGKENYQCNLHIRRGDERVDSKVGTEAYKDIADLTEYNAELADKYAMGFTTANGADWHNDHEEDFLPAGQRPNGALGFEFRASHLDNTFTTYSTGYSNRFMVMQVGSTSIIVNYHSGWKTLSFSPFNEPDWKMLGMSSTGTTNSKEHTPYRFAYDASAEYVWRITRTPVTAVSDGSVKGAIIRLYMGKIDPETDKPVANWDAVPAFECYDHYLIIHGSNDNRNGILVRAAEVNDKDGQNHSMNFSSSKYVGVKTTVGETVTVNRVERGGNFTLADNSANDMIQVGWSKGASQYSADDFVANGTQLTNLTESVSYKALTFKLTADKAASIRFRQRTIDGEVQPLEISLKWNVKAEDVSNVGYYFGGIAFGYKLTASNGASTEQEVVKVADGEYAPYTYGVIQSNIGEENYGMKFTCQAYVELNGVKYYTTAADMENDGRSVDIVADRAAADLRNEATTDNGVNYSNAIKNAEGEVIGYHYLTQEQYDLVAKAGAKNA